MRITVSKSNRNSASSRWGCRVALHGAHSATTSRWSNGLRSTWWPERECQTAPRVDESINRLQ